MNRVIETFDQLTALKFGSVVIDDWDTVFVKSAVHWFAPGSAERYDDDAIALPGRVLLESWDR